MYQLGPPAQAEALGRLTKAGFAGKRAECVVGFHHLQEQRRGVRSYWKSWAKLFAAVLMGRMSFPEHHHQAGHHYCRTCWAGRTRQYRCRGQDPSSPGHRPVNYSAERPGTQPAIFLQWGKERRLANCIFDKGLFHRYCRWWPFPFQMYCEEDDHDYPKRSGQDCWKVHCSDKENWRLSKLRNCLG